MGWPGDWMVGWKVLVPAEQQSAWPVVWMLGSPAGWREWISGQPPAATEWAAESPLPVRAKASQTDCKPPRLQWSSASPIHLSINTLSFKLQWYFIGKFFDSK